MTYYEAIKAALLPLSVPLYHNKALKQDGSYIVWSEAPTSGLYGSDRIVRHTQRIAVDYFTKTEYDGTARTIQAALEVQGFAVDDQIVPDFEEETGYMHYALTAEWG